MQISNYTHLGNASYAEPLGQPMPTHGENSEGQSYFNATSRRTTLDMALYLARYSDLVLLIHGPAGSGKSTLLREMIVRGGPNLHAVTPSPDYPLTTQTICGALLNSFKLVTTQSAPEQPVAQIKEQLDLLQRKGYHSILLIDDADELASDAYVFLETLADLRSDTGRNLLNVVLFAQDREKITFPGPTVRHRIKATALQPLAADEIPAYIEYAQRARRDKGVGIDLQPRDIQRIAGASSGWPGNIEAMIEQRLVRSAHSGSFTIPHNFPWLTSRTVITTTSITAILILVLVYQDSVNSLFEEQQVPSVAVVAPSPTPIPIQVVTAPTETTTENIDATSMSPPTVEPEIIVAALDPAEPITPPANTTVTPTSTTPQPDNWLLAQNPDAYTLQIAGSSEEDDIRRALKKFNLTDPSAVFSASRKGKPWFGLVTGVYSDFASAKQARAALPEELMRGAWVRRLRAVQSEINKPQEAEGTAAARVPPPQFP